MYRVFKGRLPEKTSFFYKSYKRGGGVISVYKKLCCKFCIVQEALTLTFFSEQVQHNFINGQRGQRLFISFIKNGFYFFCDGAENAFFSHLLFLCSDDAGDQN